MIFKSKLLACTLMIVYFFVLLGTAQASDDDGGKKIYNLTFPTTLNTEKITSGLALSMGAAAIDCTTTTRKWQVGGGIGYYGSQTAPVIGACKKYGGALFKASIGREGGVTGGNLGVMFLLE